jgi:capsular polysaccharide export protein
VSEAQREFPASSRDILPSPLLRSPPFSGVAHTIAAVSQAIETRDAHGSISTGEIDALFKSLTSARVGGSFWGAKASSGAAAHVLLRPTGPADLDAMIGFAQGQSLLVSLPQARWAQRAQRKLEAAGIAAMVGTIDPWSVLFTSSRVYAHGDDEIAALAVVAGVPLQLVSPGSLLSPDQSNQAQRSAIAGQILFATVYRDPFSAAPASVIKTIETLGHWRNIIDANTTIAVASGIAWWKRREIERFLWAPRPLVFTRSTSRAIRVARKRRGGVAIWPSRVPLTLTDGCAQLGVPVIRIEDGFVRSVGLGSNLVPPLSITVDGRGIHYDPGRPSDLEYLLENTTFPSELLERAEALRALIVTQGISKYGSGDLLDVPARKNSRRLVLVPGQVEDDMSVVCGGGDVTGNADLLSRVRTLEPDAEIWFRPHPDVDAGHRTGAVPDAEALQWADRVVRGGGMAPLLDRVDGVHVLTSLTGFEALLRERDVTTHGAPFYAGWGLTRDLAGAPHRRSRQLTLLELCAGVLILYPRYLDPVTLLPCPPEVLIARMTDGARHNRLGWVSHIRQFQGRLRKGRA